MNTAHIDGKADDPAYAYTAPVSFQYEGANARLYHSANDLYAVFEGIPGKRADRLLLLIDPDNSRESMAQPGDFQVEIRKDGSATLRRADGNGGWADQSMQVDDLEVSVVDEQGFWSLELRLPLEWLGGRGRSSGFACIIQTGEGAAASLPARAHPARPLTWGRLDLSPPRKEPLQAGSVYLDGAGGYVVFPWTPALRSQEMTVEAWVRCPGARRGSLLGEGYYDGWWLGFGGELQAQFPGIPMAVLANAPADDGWHHIAMTKTAGGATRFFVDGAEQISRMSPAPTGEGAAVRRANAGLPWRLGADRQAPADVRFLHAYVHDLRIWAYARSPEQIRAGAFRPPANDERGLAHRWPFRGDLADVAGGCHAGLVGNAALAAESPDVSVFPPAESPLAAPLTDPAAPLSSWNNVLPLKDTPAIPDGMARPEEYDGAPALPLAGLMPELKAFLGPDGLYFAVGTAPGHKRFDDHVTLLINRDGAGGDRPGPADLRITLTPDGSHEVAEGNGRTFSPENPRHVTFQAVAGDSIRFQDEPRSYALPWWTGELRIGADRLEPIKAGRRLRLAAAYKLTLKANRELGILRDTVLAGIWPLGADPDIPDTWENLQTTPPAGLGGEMEKTLSDSGPTCPWPRPAPTTADFDLNCSLSGPEKIAYLYYKMFKWPLVDPTCNPFVRAEGLLHSIGISAEDAIPLHNSHDFDMHLTVSGFDKYLSLNGGEDLVLETESKYFNRSALPGPGDHVTAYGRWIYDCGHSPKTELHPVPVLGTDRIEYRPVLPGEPFKQVAVIRMWITKNPGTYNYTNLLDGSYEFFIHLPQKDYYYYTPGQKELVPFIRQEKGPAGTMDRASFSLSGFTLKITLHQPEEGYHEFIAGFLGPGADMLQTYTVKLQEIDIKDDHDGWTKGDGEWFMLANINGYWRTVFWNREVETDESYHPDIAPVPLPEGSLGIQVIGFEDDDDFKNLGGIGDGISDIRDGYWNRGNLGDLAKKGQQTLSRGDWNIDYEVVSGGAVPPAFADAGYWAPRLLDEKPGTAFTVNVQTPAPGAPAWKKTVSSYLLQDLQIRSDQTRLLARDVQDRFQLSLSAPADIQITASPNVKYKITSSWGGWPGLYGAPESVRQLFGYSNALVEVTAKYDKVEIDIPYTMTIGAGARAIPPDWGESMDNAGGRVVDLRTPDPKTKFPANGAPSWRELELDWAWQHVPGDVDVYKVLVPKPKAHASGDPTAIGPVPCPYNHFDRVEISAPGMEIAVPAAGVAGTGKWKLTLSKLHEYFPDGVITVQIKNPDPAQRGAYQIKVVWADEKFHTKEECERITKFNKALQLSLQEIKKTYPLPFPDLRDPVPKPHEGFLVSDLVFTASGTGLPLRNDNRVSLNLGIGSVAAFPLRALLFDETGVLLGESFPEESTGAPHRSGYAFHRLRVSRVRPNAGYRLKLIPAVPLAAALAAGAAGQVEIRAIED
ncbi:MAG: hypothetical protein IPH12_13405 [Saprospirales bacterium]|nr:hypothetical protein [Saprospirales bacterium]